MSAAAIEEIVEYSGVKRMPVGIAIDWASLAQMLFDFLKNACPAKFKSQKTFSEAYDGEHRKLRLKGQRDNCPMLFRPKMKAAGVRKKADQDEAYFRLVNGANGYTLSELGG